MGEWGNVYLQLFSPSAILLNPERLLVVYRLCSSGCSFFRSVFTSWRCRRSWGQISAGTSPRAPTMPLRRSRSGAFSKAAG